MLPDPLGTRARRQAIARYEEAVAVHRTTANAVQTRADDLYELRTKDCKRVIEACEAYLSLLSNAPKELKKSFEAFTLEYQSFEATQQQLREAVERTDFTSVGLTSLSLAALTTTITHATAATSALATLGGAGMVAGRTLFSLGSPIGWVISGVILAGNAMATSAKNGQIVEKAIREQSEVETELRVLARIEKELTEMVNLTWRHAKGAENQLARLRKSAPGDYLAFDQVDRKRLSALINNVNGLSELLNRRVVVD